MKLTLLLVGFLLGVSTCFSQKETGTGSDTVFIKGMVDSPFIITRSNFGGLPVKVQTNYNVTDHNGKHTGTMKDVKGILLKDIIKKAAVQMPQKKTRGEYYVMIAATDGYKIIFAYNELMFSPSGNNSYLLFEADGKPFTEDGPFIVVCTSDEATGPRHVKWVRTIEIRKAD